MVVAAEHGALFVGDARCQDPPNLSNVVGHSCVLQTCTRLEKMSAIGSTNRLFQMLLHAVPELPIRGGFFPVGPIVHRSMSVNIEIGLVLFCEIKFGHDVTVGIYYIRPVSPVVLHLSRDQHCRR